MRANRVANKRWQVIRELLLPVSVLAFVVTMSLSAYAGSSYLAGLFGSSHKRSVRAGSCG